ncbi:MAG: NAD(P)H-hydrate dehydratase [Betaproteobacteria bacterium]|nr:NAD(P)H-hydrate dehydratase [Betaproteobacteria bacterium]MDE2622601.1 NAD(P)H-hydrate dehydratase [Betaproteobacteria bacterium]
MSTPLRTLSDIRAAERLALDALPEHALMQRAGESAAAWIASHFPASGPVWVLAGPGNNGGDGWVVAQALAAAGYPVQVLCAEPPAALPADAAWARQRCQQAGIACVSVWPRDTPGLIVDALFGIGIARAPAAPYDDWIRRSNEAGCPVVSLDVPSGLHGGSGVAFEPTVCATHTLTFLAGKPGLHTADGPDHSGIVTVLELGVPVPGHGALLEPADFADLWPRRRRNTHKGQFGAVGVLGGSPGMAGAALLAAEAALRCGAGRVWLASLDPALSPAQAALRCPELMGATAEALLELPALTALVIGPGLGQSPRAAALLEQALSLPCALVLDADALNLLAARSEWLERVQGRHAPTLLTPHPAEARRLLPETAGMDRVSAALALASRYRSLVVLKGCGSVLAEPDGRWWINASGNAGLSAPGMGDVLAGALGALLGQGLSPLSALQLAVHAHGAAADACVAAGRGPVGLTATEVTDALRQQLNSRL